MIHSSKLPSAKESFPEEHKVQEVIPVELLNSPLEQYMAVLFENIPSTQLEQLLDPAALANFPAMLGTQEFDPDDSMLFVPGGHRMHAVYPVLFSKRPGSQFKQTV